MCSRRLWGQTHCKNRKRLISTSSFIPSISSFPSLSLDSSSPHLDTRTWTGHISQTTLTVELSRSGTEFYELTPRAEEELAAKFAENGKRCVKPKPVREPVCALALFHGPKLCGTSEKDEKGTAAEAIPRVQCIWSLHNLVVASLSHRSPFC